MEPLLISYLSCLHSGSKTTGDRMRPGTFCCRSTKSMTGGVTRLKRQRSSCCAGFILASLNSNHAGCGYADRTDFEVLLSLCLLFSLKLSAPLFVQMNISFQSPSDKSSRQQHNLSLLWRRVALHLTFLPYSVVLLLSRFFPL